MRIFNIMMSRGLGGIQQAYIDYNNALKMQNHDVINIASMNAQINKQLPPNHKLPNTTSWCIFSKIYLRILALIHKPDIIICHGNRAINFTLFLKSKHTKIVGISHNYSCKYLKKCDAILTLTEDLERNLIANGADEKRMFRISNMLNIRHQYQEKPFRKPVIIGSVGRFVKKKGFSYLIKAISILKNKGVPVKLLLGGSGEEEGLLRESVAELEIEGDVNFLGWVTDMDSFFRQIDIFCLPSSSEPFGIIVLEAMEASVPIVSTRSGGPKEIIRDNIDGLLADIDSESDLAKELAILVQDEDLAKELSKNAHLRLLSTYDAQKVSEKLSEILTRL